MKKVNITELKIDDVTGIDAIALVANPAIEVDFMQFNKDSKPENSTNLTFAKTDNSKRIVTGPAMIPDKLMYRYDREKDFEFYAYFTKDTVEAMSYKLMMQQNQSNVNIEHTNKLIPDVTVVESWIVVDPETDKSKALGFTNLPKGTWMISMKVNNDTVWNDLIKKNNVKGFSIEGYFLSKFSK